MADKKYDVVVVGAGPGGYVAAIRAAQLGQGVAIVEREHLGGVCLNWGCIPTKALLRNAELAQILTHGDDFGFSFDNLTLDYSKAHKRSRQVAERLSKGVGFLMRKNKIEHLEGHGRLISANKVAVGDNGQEVEAKNVILATGARARPLPDVEVDGKQVFTYREALELTEIPSSVIVVGAGAIGMEFAYVLRAYGAEVTIVEMLPRVLPLEDEESSAEVHKAFEKQGMQIHTGARTDEVKVSKKGVSAKLKSEDGETQTIEAEAMLVAIGVQPNSENLGLEDAGVETDDRGFVPVDGYMRTNVSNVYAIGDLTGKLPLAHVASAQGIVATEQIAGHETHPIEDYLAMPRCTYCIPQVASLGLSEEQAREQGYEIKVSKFPFQANGKALALGDSSGWIKLIADARYGELLGAHLVGPEVTELLPELALAKSWELTAEEIARTVHAHPTLSEVIMEAAHGIEGSPIHI